VFRQFIQVCVCAEALKCKCKATDVQIIFNEFKRSLYFAKLIYAEVH
jgi:hypothetical protein